MIAVVATITVRPGQRAAFLREFRTIVAPTLAEDGCLQYEPTVDVAAGVHAAQVAPRPDVVTVVERWRDLAALRAHLTAPHMAAYRERVKGIVLSAQLQILEPA